jgi:hypothetical protein
MSGQILSKNPIIGKFPDGDQIENVSFGGLSYSPSGKLYGNAIIGFNVVTWFEISLDGVSVAYGNTQIRLALSEICIDSAGTLYGHSDGKLYSYNSTTGSLINVLQMERLLDLGAIICR